MKTLQKNLKSLVGILTLALAVIVVTGRSHAATYTVSVPPGFSPIANNLNSTLAGGNTLANLFNATTTNPAIPAGTQILIWNCAIHDFDTYIKTTSGSGWTGLGATALLNPGDGAFINVPGGSGFIVTFSGNAPTATTSKWPCIPAGSCGLLSSQLYLPGPLADFEGVAGFALSDCYSVAKYIPGQPIQPVTPANYTIYSYVNGSWSPGTPSVAPGESVWICNTTNCHSVTQACVMAETVVGGSFTNAGPFVKPDGFGNIYVGFTKFIGPGNSDVVILKYDCHCAMASGWPQIFDANGGVDELIGMDVDRSGSLYITCASSGSLRGARTLKYDPAGNSVWQQSGLPGRPPPSVMGSGSTAVSVESFRPVGVAVDKGDRVLVGGTITPPALAPTQIGVMYYFAPDGSHVYSGVNPLGPSLNDRANAMTLGHDNILTHNSVSVAGDYDLATGGSCLTVRFNYGLTVSGVRRMALSSGRNLSAVAIAASPNAPYRIHTLARDSFGGVDRWTIFTYVDNGTLPPAGAWTGGGGAPTLSNGELRYDGTRPLWPTAIAADTEGNVIVTGYDTAAGWVTAKWDAVSPATGPVWSTAVLTPGSAPAALRLDRLGHAYVAGWTTGSWPQDYLTARFDSGNGALDWYPMPAFDHSGFEDMASDVAVDSGGDTVFVTGRSRAVTTALDDVINTLKYVQGPVGNDFCGAARQLNSCKPGTVGFNNRFATDTTPLLSLCGADNHDVWYKWVAPCNGMVQVDTCGSCFATALDVYDAGPGGDCSSLGWLDCNAVAGDGRCVGGVQSFVQFQATSGNTYYFQVGGATSADVGEGRLTVTGPDPVPATCPTIGFSGIPRVFRLTGPPNGQDWPWSITIPCCGTIQGTAGPVSPSGTTLQLAQAFANSLQNNSTCPGAIEASAVSSPGSAARLKIRVKRCMTGCANNAFILRVGPHGTPYSQLCIVPNILGATISTLPSPGICQFNPSIEEIQEPFVDANGNGQSDDVDIAASTSQDVNTNSIPDECEEGCTNGGQVYTLDLQAGANYLANQLNRPGGNTVGNVLPSASVGFEVRKWNGSVFTANTFDPDLGGWADPAMTLNPGEGFVLSVPEATTLTFAGCPNAPHFLPAVTNGCVLVANTTNAAARYEDLFGQPPGNCTTVTMYEGTNVATYTYFSGYGWSPSEPILGVGAAAFVCGGAPCQPVLSVQGSGSNVILSWTDPNFRLQTTPIVSSGPVWTSVPGASPLTLPIGPDPLFFRLVIP